MEYLSIFLAFTLLSPISSHIHKLNADDFSLKFIENYLNLSKTNENVVVAPFEGFQLYKDIFNIEDDDNGGLNKEDDEYDTRHTVTLIPAIRKQQKILHSTEGNNLDDLFSTISLTARWSFNFQTRDTHKRIFYQHGKPNQKIWVDFLRKDDNFYYTHDEQLNASVLELPLNVKKIKLTLILPDKLDGLAQLKEYLLNNMDEFNELINRSHKMTLVRVLLPKFYLSYKADLKAFFKEVSNKDIEKYENIYQYSKLEFNERGIGHFERMTVLFWNAYSYLRVSPELYDVNHPFLFFITNEDGIQFFGQVVRMHHH